MVHFRVQLARFVHDAVPGRADSGVGNVLQSLFPSPSAPAANGLIWGAGPVFLLPTGTDDLGADQFAMGVTGVALKQCGPWTFGVLANHLWDVSGGGDATDISTSHAQPFLNHTSTDAVTFALNTETSHVWNGNEGAVPINLMVSKVVSLGGGVRYRADGPETGPDGWGARAIVTFLFPR
ncbi:MAG: hypothetical protein ACK5IP_08670 [Paracoccus sp. (in: a-proteobacteria)]